MQSRASRRLHHARWLIEDRVRFVDRQVRTSTAPRLRHAVERAEVVSLDVFDTAIFRCVPEPADVFEIVGQRLLARGETTIDAGRFRHLRIEAETSARATERRKGSVEVRLQTIYEHLAQLVPGLDTVWAQTEELAVERAVCFANADIRRLYQNAQAAAKRVVFVSDTYFPTAFVEELLRAAGFTGNHRVYASSEHVATKESGGLFGVVAASENVDPSAIVHIGDNMRADVAMGRRHGFNVFWYRRTIRPVTYVRHARPFQERILARMVAVLAEDREPDMLRTTGLEVIGPVFLAFTQWLMQRLEHDAPDLIVFCARDGALLKMVFERLLRSWPGPERLYFMGSRRALIFPSITVLDERALLSLCANNSALPVAGFFSRIGIDVAKYPAELAAAGLAPDTRVYSETSRNQLEQLFRLLEPKVLERARAERPLLLEYLRQTGILTTPHVALVDVGWGGTMQGAIAEVVADEGYTTLFTGYYVSTDERVRRLTKRAGRTFGWLANGGRPFTDQIVVSMGYWLLEIASSANHGTTVGYRREDSGAVEAVLHDFDATTTNARAAEAMQRAGLEVVERWAGIFDGAGPTLSRDVAFARFKHFVEHPSMEQVRVFGDFVHVGGLGVTSEETPIARPPTFAEALRNPTAVLAAYRETHWRIALLQRMFRSNGIALGSLKLIKFWRTGKRLVRGAGLAEGPLADRAVRKTQDPKAA